MTDAVRSLEVLRQGSPRVGLRDAPARVLAWLEGTLGSPVAVAVTQTGGFSPGVAARLVCADGTRAFVKAVGTALNPDSPGLVRQEVRALTELPDTPLRARVLDAYDDGDWVALLLEDIDAAMPDLPASSRPGRTWTGRSASSSTRGRGVTSTGWPTWAASHWPTRPVERRSATSTPGPTTSC